MKKHAGVLLSLGACEMLKAGQCGADRLTRA
jgi:hypothetical protein